MKLRVFSRQTQRPSSSFRVLVADLIPRFGRPIAVLLTARCRDVRGSRYVARLIAKKQGFGKAAKLTPFPIFVTREFL
jgi:hypothetical protein